MNPSILAEQTNEDTFILDRDQPEQRRQSPSTPLRNYSKLKQSRTTTTIYEIIKTLDQQVVLVHEQQPNTIITEGTVRITKHNSVIPDDGFLNHISEYSSSEGYYSGSDWDTDSSWRSFDSTRDDLATFFDFAIRSISQFILPDQPEHRAGDCDSLN